MHEADITAQFGLGTALSVADFVASLDPRLQEGVKSFFDSQFIMGPNDILNVSDDDLSEAMRNSEDLPTLGHKAALRKFKQEAAPHQAEAAPHQPGSSAGGQLDAMRAVYALAQGDALEAARLLGSNQERRDALLKNLIKEAKLGEPSRQAQPEDEDINAAQAAKKNGVFPKVTPPSDKEIAKQERPLAWVLTTGLPKLWAYLLHGTLSSADALNLLYHCGCVANDRRYEAHPAAQASIRYFWDALEQAWRESRRSESEEELLKNVAITLYEFDDSKADKLLQEQKASNVTHDGGRFCLKFLTGRCFAKDCKFKHGCPFCNKMGSAAELQTCFESHLRSQRLGGVRSESSYTNGKGTKGAGKYQDGGKQRWPAGGKYSEQEDRQRSRSRRRGRDKDH